MEKTLQELASLIKGTVIGSANTRILGVTGIEFPKVGYLAYITDSKQLKDVENSPLAALIVPAGITSAQKPVIQVENPKLAWALLLSLYNPPDLYSKIVSPQAYVAKSAKIGNHVTIEAFAHVGENTVIGNDSVVRAFSYIDSHCKIGEKTVIHPNVTIYTKTQIGNDVTIHAGTIIGADGFGYVFDGSKHAKIPQVGNVIIEDQVEIGACVTIDRATIGSTIVRKGAKIDNLVQIAHNVEIGSHTCLSAQTGISGSSKIGNYVTMGGRVGLGDHCEIGDQAMLGAQSGVPSGKSIPAKQIWIGAPARPYQEMRKQIGAQLRSYETQQLVSELKKRIETLEQELKDLRTTKS